MAKDHTWAPTLFAGYKHFLTEKGLFVASKQCLQISTFVERTSTLGHARFVHPPGHRNATGNEYADTLARTGVVRAKRLAYTLRP